MIAGAPPGRSGRLWLDQRLRVARRGADVLERKLRILQAELQRLAAVAVAAQADWDTQRAEASRRLLRTSVLGGQRAVRLASDGRYAEVSLEFSSVMGVRVPATASCLVPEAGTWDGPGLAAARQSCAAALQAGVRYAVAASAVRTVDAEAAATTYRLRAIRDRWIPRLEQAMAELTFAIEETELADAARLRLAKVPGSGPERPSRSPGR